jgi:hypothetical protein
MKNIHTNMYEKIVKYAKKILEIPKKKNTSDVVNI